MNSHTEKEARIKWCPMVRGPLFLMGGTSEHYTAVNRNDRGEAMGGCIGSTCMWWQWDPQSAEPRIQARTQAEKIAMAKEPLIPTRGFCGAAAR